MTILKNITYGIFNITVLVPGTVDTFKNIFLKNQLSVKLCPFKIKQIGGGVGWGGVGWGGVGGINCLARSWQNLFLKKEKTNTQKERGVKKKKNIGRRKTDRRQAAHIMYLDYNRRKY